MPINARILLDFGLKSELPSAMLAGRLFYCTDTHELFVGTGLTTPMTAVAGAVDLSAYATQAFVGDVVAGETARAETAEALLAPLASPAFTGTVSAGNQNWYVDGQSANFWGASMQPYGDALGLSLNFQDIGNNSLVAQANQVFLSAPEGQIVFQVGATQLDSLLISAGLGQAAVALKVHGDGQGSDILQVTDSDGLTVLSIDTDGNLAVNGGTVSGITAPMVGADPSGAAASAVAAEATNRNAAIAVETTRATTAEGLLVPKTTTVNGHALSGNVVVSASDLTTGTLPHAQLPTLLSGDIPDNAANTSGTAANLSGTPALPNGTTATTQAGGDNSTKLATTAYADAAVLVETARAETAEALLASASSVATAIGAEAANRISGDAAALASAKAYADADIATEVTNRNAAIAARLPRTVANRTLTAQAAVDGSTGAVALYTVPTGGAGTYRVVVGILPRTKSSSAWIVNADYTPPTGVNIPAQLGCGINMQSGGLSSTSVQGVFYCHDADAFACGTVTASGANTGGAFDVSWTVERIA